MYRWTKLAAPTAFVLGLAATLFAYASAERQALEVARLRYEVAVDDHAAQFRRHVGAQALAANAFAGLLSVKPDITQADFQHFAGLMAPDYPSVVAVNWFPKVEPEAIPVFETYLREAGATNPTVRGAHGDPIAPETLDRPAFPVLMTAPLEENRGVLGFDVASSPQRRPALEAARDLGSPVSSEPVPLVQLPGVLGTNLYAPVYRGTGTESLVSRRTALAGYISIAYRIDGLIREGFPDPPTLFDIHVYDSETGTHLGGVHADGAGEARPSLADLASAERRRVTWGERDWTLAFEPGPDAFSAQTGPRTTLVLVFGLVATLGLTAYLLTQDQARRKIAAALAEKETLFKEIHHRIKNHLQVTSSLLQMQGLQFEDAKVRAAFQDTESRLQSVGLIHDLLYKTDNLSGVDLGVYVQRLAEALADSYGAAAKGIAVRVELDPVVLDMDRAVPVALVVTEVLTNAFKHAFPEAAGGEVVLGVHRSDGVIAITVRDSGPGMPATTPPRGLGQTLIRALVAQVDGSFSFTNDNGAVFRMTIPATGG